ncbi:MAG: phosphoglycerate kinase [Chloroflexota bacterium]|nr:phosphoglycerate kinase [Chloroflexota bacterium]
MTLLSVQNADVRNKRVLVRVDFNVPLDGDAIRDDTRIRSALPTINSLLQRGAAVILCSHLGRPKGTVEPKFSLAPVAAHLETLVDAPVAFVRDVAGEQAAKAADQLQSGEILLLENLRFEPGEEKNDPELAQKLAGLADLYVNDAFGAAHRAHTSTEAVALLLPAYAGSLMLAEVEALTRLKSQPREGFVAFIGGAKVSDKIAVLEALVPVIETLAIGGGMANTFLLESGVDVGTSLTEPDSVEVARRIRDLSTEHGTELLLPTDLVVADSIEATLGTTVPVGSIPADQAAFDIGPETTRRYADSARNARTIFWNGPMGVFENQAFAAGTLSVAQAVADCSGYTLVGGGDSVAAVEAAGVADRISHISTGGGASLEFVEGRTLPGIAALERRSS